MENIPTSSNVSVIQRVTLSHLQVVGIIGSFNFQWPSSVKTTFQTFRTIASLSFLSDGVGGGIKCSLYLQEYPNPVNDLLINLVILIISLSIIALFWMVYNFCRIKISRKYSASDVDLTTKQKIIISFIALLYLVYVSLSLSFSLSLSVTHTHTLSLKHSHTHAHYVFFSLSLIHT